MNNKQTLKQTFEIAAQNYKKKEFKAAEIICNKILNIDPNHFDSITLLANMSALGGDYKNAKDLLLKAVELQPKNTGAMNNLAIAYKELGKIKEAINYFDKLLKINPNYTNAIYNLGLIFYKLKNYQKAKEYLQRTVEIQNNFAYAFFSLGNVHVDLKEYDDAISCYQKAIEINPKIPGAHNNLGLVFRICNDFLNAINCYKEVIKIQPSHAGAHHNMATALKELGKFDNAIKSHYQAIKYEPENPSHYYYLSDLKKEIIDQDLRKKMEKVIANKNISADKASFANYLLSRYEKKLKNYKKEIDYLIEAHKLYFESKKEKFQLGVKYCFDDVLQVSKGINVNKINTKNEYEISPIFIIGVPRCGSTLVEKIIASGKKFIPLGEETAVIENFINEKILDKKSFNIGDVDEIRSELNDIYKSRGIISKKYNNIFTDKSLNNFFYLNFIKSIYPKAKIINCKRDKLSSIISIFQNNLAELAWAHDLENIFKYFDNYINIVKDFNNSNPDLVYNLEFEQLTSDTEKESKKLMEFCSLPWDKKCLEFYKRKDLISKTASNIQIRQAIYKHSLNKYLPYKEYLSEYSKKYTWLD